MVTKMLTILQGNVLLENNISGALCISQAWPGMARTIYNDHKRFLETYLTPYPGKGNRKKGRSQQRCLVGYSWVCLLVFCMGAGLRRAGTATSFFHRPSRGIEALHLPMPDTSALPWEWVSLTSLPHWITCGFRAMDLSFCPQSA